MNLSMAVITAPAEVADDLAGGLVERQLAACVQVMSGANSTYMWQGYVERERESVLFVKTATELRDKIVEYLREAHPYDVPELIFFPIVGGHPEYLQWMEDNLTE